MPWCPACRAEYRPGIATCAEPECEGAALVAEPIPDPQIVEVYVAADALEAQHLAGLLADDGIEATLADHADHVFPTHASAGGGARLAVAAHAMGPALDLIASARADGVISQDGAFLQTAAPVDATAVIGED